MLNTILTLMLTFACGEKSNDTGIETLEDTNNSEIEDTQTDETNDTNGIEDTEDTEDTEVNESTSDYEVDSSDSTTWIYFSLNDGTVVTPENPEDSTEWDLKFQRYTIGVNGGVNGTAGVQIMIQEGTYDTYIDIVALPEDGVWITDEEDADADGNPEYAFASWYDYDLSTHSLSPKNQVYFVQNTIGTYKFRIVDYYNDSGESGFVSFDAELIE